MKSIKHFLRSLWGTYLYYKYKRIYEKDPKKAADAMYYKIYGQHMNLDNPENLIEKITWLSLNTDTSLWTLCADKYRMRSYVESKGLGQYLPECYGFWENPDDIDFSKLPNQFVLKANNGCATVMIVRDKSKLNEAKVKKQMKGWLKRKFGYMGAQKHYLTIKPGILAEELLTQSKELDKFSPSSMVDFKIWCFNGEPESILVVYDRNDCAYKLSLYDLDWNATPENLNEQWCNLQKSIPGIQKPKHLGEMIQIAKELSKGFKEVRVDFYQTENGPVLGELTFTTGYGYFTNKYYKYLGSKIELSNIINK